MSRTVIFAWKKRTKWFESEHIQSKRRGNNDEGPSPGRQELPKESDDEKSTSAVHPTKVEKKAKAKPQFQSHCDLNKLASQFEDAPVTASVGNMCRFACPECKYKSDTWFTMRKHIKKKHKEMRRVDVNAMLERVAFHECQVCKIKILCDNTKIMDHVTSAHGISRLTYISRYRLTEETKRGAQSVTFNELAADVPARQKRAKIFDGGKDAPKGIVPKNEVGNLCLFVCNFCVDEKVTFRALNTLFHHVRGAHKDVKAGKYRVDRETILEARYHSCVDCQYTMLCDKYFIARHVKHCHKKTLEEYVRNVQEMTGKRAVSKFPDSGLAESTKCPTVEMIDPSMISSESEESDLEN